MRHISLSHDVKRDGFGRIIVACSRMPEQVLLVSLTIHEKHRSVILIP